MKQFIVEVETKQTVELRRVDFQFPESDGPEQTLKSIARCRVETDLLRTPELGKCRILTVYNAGPAEPGQNAKEQTEHAKNHNSRANV